MTNQAGKHLTLILANGASTRIELTQKILGSGGDAKIFPIANDPHTIAKIYHDPDKDPDRQDKIKAMLETPPDLPPIIENGKTYIQIAWPTGILTGDRGRFLGYAMPFVDLKNSTVLDNLLVKKIRKVLGVPEFYGFRVVAAANLAGLVESLHALGHHIIDLKPVNLNVYTDSFYVSLLDCDGLSIHGRNGKRYPAHQYTDGFIAPEALRHQSYPRDLGEDQDRFALAVIIFQLLNNGIHPFQGTPLNHASIPPTNSGRILGNLYAYSRQGNPKIGPSLWSIHKYFEDETRQLFDRAFGPDPHLRPGASEWRKHLRNLTDPGAGLLKRCSQNPEHAMFSKGCGFCHLQKIRSQKVRPAPGKNINRPTTTRPRTTGSLRSAPGGRTWPMWVKWAMAGALAACVILFFYRQSLNIHNVIRTNNQSRFFDQVDKNMVPWEQLNSQDLSNALAHRDNRLFSAILRYKKTIFFEYGILEKLIEKKNEQLTCTYIRKVDEIDLDPDIITQISQTKSDALAKCYLNKMTEQGALKDESKDEFFAAVFLSADHNMVRRIIDLGANPDMKIALPRDCGTFKSLFATKTRVNNYAGTACNAETCNKVPSLAKYCSNSFPIPGMSRLHDLTYEKSVFDVARPDRSRVLYGYSHRHAVQYMTQPLIIAVLKNDLETIQTLVKAGADVNIIADNQYTLLGLAQSIEAYQILKRHQAASEQIEPFILNDDPSHLSKAVAGMKKGKKRAYLTDVMQKAEMIGSVCIIDELINHYKMPFYPEKPTTLINAYMSENPLLLAYYLGKGADFDTPYSTDQFFHRHVLFQNECLNTIDGMRDFALNQQIRANYCANKETKIGEILLTDIQLHRNCWGMAFVLKDHLAKWSQLHFSVLENNVSRIENTLKAEPDKIEQRDGMGRTPLSLAVLYQCEQSYDALIKFNPDLEAEDDQGYTPLMHAVSYGNTKLTRDLIARGATLVTKSHPDCSMALTICLKNKIFIKQIDQYLGDTSPHKRSLFDISQTYREIRDAARQAGLTACKKF